MGFTGFIGFTCFIGFTGSLSFTGLSKSVLITFPGSTTPNEELAQVESTSVPEVQLINT